jgi:tRNA A37 threonylcarbamoyladenosine modification protein TsaB
LILFSSALELTANNIIIMKNLIVDATRDKIFLTLIVSKNIYTCSHENSKINFEKLMILINDFLKANSSSLDQIDVIYVNRGPGSFAGIRNSLATIKALFLTKKINYYCFSFEDFTGFDQVNYEDVPSLCEKFKIKKNLINPIYLS